MSKHTLADGVARLEAISAEFDYDKAQQYVLLAKEFLRVVREFSSGKAISDVCGELGVDLPQQDSERLAAFLGSKPNYAPTTQKICRWYLLELHAMDLKMKPEGQSIYESLIQMLELGGDFYEHHGALCIRDAAMLPFSNAMS
ncbi:hypothetical protein [uncultured Gimesia sp.]|uniref:hypothetical protein n=1 Tax=uncultured Gimesia sp. TaxID=1678688 RepID=UPI002624DE1C|nr:hypothetical protein [uncultured Gimesia sp.]